MHVTRPGEQAPRASRAHGCNGTFPLSFPHRCPKVFCISWSSVTLCQYVGCCGHTGSNNYAWERFVHVVAGVLLPVAVNHTIAPW